MATKVMVSFPEEFLAEVDRIARQEHRSRSELVREALRLYMDLRQGQEGPGERRAIREAAMLQNYLVPGTRKDRLTRARQGVGGTLDETDRRAVRELQRRLATIVPVLDLRVFGSRARGDAAPDSDLDLFIEVEEATPELRQQISEAAWEVGFELDRVITTLVVTRADLEEGAMGANPLMLEVEREGVRP